MAKNYIIKLDGWLKERLEIEEAKGIFSYTTIVKLALSDFFEKIDEDNSNKK